MIKKITYELKNALQNDEDVPDNEKVTDTDMNEIKDVVNTNADELNRTKEKLDLTINAPLIYKGSVETKEELELIENPKSGYIYTVNSEQKNYIFSDTEWLEYNATIDISSISNTLEEQNNKIEENTTNILENSNAIEQNSTDISNIEKSVSQNTSNISENTQDISDLNSKVTQLEGKSGISLYNSSKQSMPKGLNEINFSNTDFVVGSSLQKSGNHILVKKAGLVFVTFKIMLNSGFDGNQNLQLLVQCGSVQKFYAIRPTSNSSFHYNGSALFNAKANDTILMKFNNFGSGAIQISDTNSTYGNRLEAFYL